MVTALAPERVATPGPAVDGDEYLRSVPRTLPSISVRSATGQRHPVRAHLSHEALVARTKDLTVLCRLRGSAEWASWVRAAQSFARTVSAFNKAQATHRKRHSAPLRQPV